MNLKLTRHAVIRFKERILFDVDYDFIHRFVSSELSVATHLYSYNGKDYFHSSGITFVLAKGCLVTLYLASL